MKRNFSTLFVTVLALAAVSCDDALQQLPPEAQFTGDSTSRCDIRGELTAAQQFFQAADDRQTVQQLLFTLKNACLAGDTNAVTDLAFDIFEVIEAALNAGTTNSAQAGAELTDLLCDKAGVSASVDVAAFQPEGAYCVVPGADPDAPCLARDGNPWGAGPEVGEDWTDVPPAGVNQMLITGNPLPAADFPTPELVVTAYEWFVKPALPFASGPIVGACFSEAPDMIQQESAIIPWIDPPFCTGSLAARGVRSTPSLLNRALGLAARLVRPRPLQALAVIGGGVGGKGNSFSKFAIVNAGISEDGSGTASMFDRQPGDGVKNEVVLSTDGVNPVKLTVKTADNVAIAGAEVTIIAVKNNGQPAEICNVPAPDPCRGKSITVVTDANGMATLDNLRFTKTGAYRLIASADLGFASATWVSQKFNIRPS